jgi:hypothetical protein
MTQWRSRLIKQLRKDRSIFPSLDASIAELEAWQSPLDRIRLGLALASAAATFGMSGELLLLEGDSCGWGLLRAARWSRASSFLLRPQLASSSQAALAALEALQWGEVERALRVVRVLGHGIRGTWNHSRRLLPSNSELESLAFALVDLQCGTSFGQDLALAPLEDFAPAAGLFPDPNKDVGWAFNLACAAYGELCRDSGEVPRGARLSAAPVFACLVSRRERGLTLPTKDDPADDPLMTAPFSEFDSGQAWPMDLRIELLLERVEELVHESEEALRTNG